MWERRSFHRSFRVEGSLPYCQFPVAPERPEFISELCNQETVKWTHIFPGSIHFIGREAVLGPWEYPVQWNAPALDRRL